MIYNLLLVLLTISVSAISARADSFRLTGAGVDDTFNLPATPVVSASGAYGFSIDAISIDESGTDVSRDVLFFSTALGGGLLISSAAGTDVNGFGEQLYQGPPNSPVLQPGSYILAGENSYNLTISNPTITPEPQSLLLFGIGLLGVFGVVAPRYGGKTIK